MPAGPFLARCQAGADARFSAQQARQLGKADEERLRRSRKLVLLVDLDQTLVHTTSDNVPADMQVSLRAQRRRTGTGHPPNSTGGLKGTEVVSEIVYSRS